MNDFNYSPKQREKSLAPLDYFLILVGLTLIFTSICIFAIYMVRNNQSQSSHIVANSEDMAYRGESILRVPAGSKEIETLAYSSQVPVVVMFDTDW